MTTNTNTASATMNAITFCLLEKAARDNGFDLPAGDVTELRFWTSRKADLGEVVIAEDEHGYTVRHNGMTYRCPSRQDVHARLWTIYHAA
jgi:hypothetical protein